MKILRTLKKAVTLTAFLPIAVFAIPSNSSDVIARGERGGSHHEEGHHHHEEGHHEGEHHHENEEHEGEHHENFDHHDFHGNYGEFHGGGTYINGGGGVQENPVIVPNPNPVYVVPPSDQGNQQL